MNSQILLSANDRKNTIITLKNLVDSVRNNYKNNSQSFKDLERQDIIAFLDIYRKLEDVDPLHMDRHLQTDTCATW
jgi:hypothetical protein